MRERIDFTPDFGSKTSNSIIKVIGVGGGGGNAVKHMYSEGIVGVDFLICNTDRQVLESNQVPSKLILGDSGLGAGAKPEVARKFAEESREKIIEFIGEETKMLFITAGMGKGTGTGAAPVIAQIAQEMGILTIGVVTYPFKFEGKVRGDYAEAGIEELKKHVDSLIVVKNQNILKYYQNEILDEAFGFADDVLKNAVKCIAELITVNADQNIDFRDIETVMKESGPAMLGLATASGPDRIEQVVENALACPLLDENLITNAKNFLFFISYGKDNPLKISELETLTERFESIKTDNSDVIWGRALDESLGDAVKLSVIITNYKTADKPIDIPLEEPKTEITSQVGEKQKDSKEIVFDKNTLENNVTTDPFTDLNDNKNNINQDKKEPEIIHDLFENNGSKQNLPGSSTEKNDEIEINNITIGLDNMERELSINNSGTINSDPIVVGEFKDHRYEDNDIFTQLTERPAILRNTENFTNVQTMTPNAYSGFEVENDINALFNFPD